tara:strand:+ start:1023 stop:2357 length:1335 start_codon:yes stop_codon:yes gene_type:complete
MSIANIKSSLHSDGRFQANLFDELSDSTRNVGIDSIGTFHCNDITEGSATGLASTVPMRITDNKELLVYDQIDEMNPVSNIMGNLIDLAQNGFAGLSTQITSSNLSNVQEIIENADPHFNVFAVISYDECAEDLSGVASGTGRTTFTGPGFVYNTSNNDLLSTGYDIKPMSGAAANTERVKHDVWDYYAYGAYYSLNQKIDLGRLLDGKKWMGMAVFDGYSDTTNIPKGFRGISLWVFEEQTGSYLPGRVSINYNPEDYLTTTPNDPVVKVRDIFYPAGSATDLHVVQTLELERDSSGISFPKLSHQFLAYGDTADDSGGIGPSTTPIGTQDTTSSSGQAESGYNRPGTKTRWRFSPSNTGVTSTGYYTTSAFSSNNGIWGYNVGSAAAGGVNYLDFDEVIPVAFGNFNGSDGASAAMRAKWKGQNISGTDWVCFIFSGDALPS